MQAKEALVAKKVTFTDCKVDGKASWCV